METVIICCKIKQFNKMRYYKTNIPHYYGDNLTKSIFSLHVMNISQRLYYNNFIYANFKYFFAL